MRSADGTLECDWCADSYPDYGTLAEIYFGSSWAHLKESGHDICGRCHRRVIGNALDEVTG